MEIKKNTFSYIFLGILIIAITIVISLLSIYCLNTFNLNDTFLSQFSEPISNFIIVNYLYLGILLFVDIIVIIHSKKSLNKELFNASLFLLALLVFLIFGFTGAIFY